MTINPQGGTLFVGLQSSTLASGAPANYPLIVATGTAGSITPWGALS